MSRRYLVRPLPASGVVRLPDPVAHHLAVVRVRVGDLVELFDGEGRQATARIEALERRGTFAAVDDARVVDREPATRVELACALPKGNRAEWLFEHGTEVGVRGFRPVRFARTAPARAERRTRWERIVAAAAEQCDRSHLPTVHDEVTLDALLADPGLPAERYVAAPGAAVELGTAATSHCVVIVGPEGGLTADELERLAAAGFAPRGLGRLTLRTETAALVAAARLLA